MFFGKRLHFSASFAVVSGEDKSECVQPIRSNIGISNSIFGLPRFPPRSLTHHIINNVSPVALKVKAIAQMVNPGLNLYACMLTFFFLKKKKDNIYIYIHLIFFFH